MNSLDANGRLRDLESTCEDLRRRLAEERQVKENFEDLLTALKGELQSSHNERDNLRDEIVPQLRARVEGLEAQAAQHERLTYEQSKMQQELQTLKDENISLINSQRLQKESQQKKFNSIAEETAGPTNQRASIGLARSNSLAQGPTIRSRPSSLSRSASVKTIESREALAERVKDVELQRDALHRALKSLLERQEHQNRENQKKIRQLEMERDRALSSSPKRLAYGKEVASLREEINTLRRRADEAIEQKWQCEKGLSGLKMDLDRAEQEIGSLRDLLQENDILVPATTRSSNGSRPGSSPVSSESLERAYRDLQKEYKESLERVKALELSGSKDAETERAMKQLEQSLADALSERDFAKQEADALRQQSDSLRQSEKVHLGDELALADELRGSAKRVEALATQVRQQLASNATLRQRLAETIERGEREQKANADKIMFMQSKLKSLEDQLMAAQQSSEETIARHEDEIRGIKENHNVQLQRVKDGMRSPRLFGPKSPVASLFTNSVHSPRILSTTSGKAISVSEDSKMDFLKQRVVELESALADADREMEEVVGRMNVAQIEVMELQNEREEAVRETKRLQKKIEEERIRAFEGRFATLSS
jgi:chromosome segregation ATPase